MTICRGGKQRQAYKNKNIILEYKNMPNLAKLLTRSKFAPEISPTYVHNSAGSSKIHDHQKSR